MGYFSNMAIKENEDREYVDPAVLDKLEASFSKRKTTKKASVAVVEEKHNYIFEADGRGMYYAGQCPPVFNYHQAKKFSLTATEAKKKAQCMSKKYTWKAIRVS